MKAPSALPAAALLLVAASVSAPALDLAIPTDCGNCPLGLREACAWDHISTETAGGHWQSRWSVRTSLEPVILLGVLNEELQKKGWRLGESTGGSRNGWRFRDADGGRWLGSATVERGARPGQLIVSVSVDRPIEGKAR